MVSLNGFNAADVEPSKAFDALPAGEYTAIITESAMNPTKAGTGEYLKLTFEIVDGEHKGRKLWENLNLDNPSKQAVEIAKANLSAICRAIGVLNPGDSTSLHNLPLTVVVRQEKDKDSSEIRNRIKGYKAREARAAAPVAAGGPAPWKQKAS